MAKSGSGADNHDKDDSYGGDRGAGGRKRVDSIGFFRNSTNSGGETPKKNKKSKRRVSQYQLKPIKLSRVGGSPRLDEGRTFDAPPPMRRKGGTPRPPLWTGHSAPAPSAASASATSR